MFKLFYFKPNHQFIHEPNTFPKVAIKMRRKAECSPFNSKVASTASDCSGNKVAAPNALRKVKSNLAC